MVGSQSYRRGIVCCSAAVTAVCLSVCVSAAADYSSTTTVRPLHSTTRPHGHTYYGTAQQQRHLSSSSTPPLTLTPVHCRPLSTARHLRHTVASAHRLVIANRPSTRLCRGLVPLCSAACHPPSCHFERQPHCTCRSSQLAFLFFFALLSFLLPPRCRPCCLLPMRAILL